MYANITGLVQALDIPYGAYTVANVRATNGRISGGSSAGWTIIIVYEEDNAQGKMITTYDGFAGVTKKSTDIRFHGFKTLPDGDVKATIAGAALEGYLRLKGDMLMFKTDEMKDLLNLKTTSEKKIIFLIVVSQFMMILTIIETQTVKTL